MKIAVRAIAAALLAIAFALPVAPTAQAQSSFSPDQRGEIERRSIAKASRNTPKSFSRRRAKSPSATRRVTSPWSSSSITIAAIANAPWTT
jgi:hypothetical protein